jgi:hypothetical protein
MVDSEQHPKYPTSKVVAFAESLRKHKTTFILVAVLTVFSSFIVKDALREEYKDMSDSLARAEDNYVATMNTAALRGDIVVVRNQIISINKQIERNLTAIKDSVTKRRTLRDERGDNILFMGEIMGSLQAGISRDRLDIKSSWDLVSGLPDSPEKSKLAADMTTGSTHLNSSRAWKAVPQQQNPSECIQRRTNFAIRCEFATEFLSWATMYPELICQTAQKEAK